MVRIQIYWISAKGEDITEREGVKLKPKLEKFYER